MKQKLGILFYNNSDKMRSINLPLKHDFSSVKILCPVGYLGSCSVHAQPLQSCPTLCDSMDCGPPGSSVHGILQARILEWVAVPSSRNLPDPGIKPVSPVSPALQADSLPQSHWEAQDVATVPPKVNTLKKMTKHMRPASQVSSCSVWSHWEIHAPKLGFESYSLPW